MEENFDLLELVLISDYCCILFCKGMIFRNNAYYESIIKHKDICNKNQNSSNKVFRADETS